MKPKRRILSLLLAICLVVGIMPTAAFAANNDKAIQLGASNISGYDITNGYDYIYYGEWDNSPIKWRVLDEQTNTQNEGLFLLSDVLLGTGTSGGVYFDSTSPYGNAWQGSDAQDWCKTFYSDSLTTQEQSAVLETTKSDTAFTSSTYSVPFAASENILNGDKVFFLSAEEAENSAYGFQNDTARIANYGNSAGVWWLRSPYALNTDIAGAVYFDGYVYILDVIDDWAARPAFNLNLNSVLFTSAAAGGKSANGMDSGLTAIGNYAGNEWKLTLLDETREFAVTEQTVSGAPGGTITLNYTGATTGTNEYISVIIADSNGSTLYYGRVAQPDSANGQVEIKIPDSLAAGEYTLNVFSEQYNGDYKTDYASAFAEVALTVSSDTTAPTLTPGSATRDSETAATVKFTSDEAGEYYYAVVESGAEEPSIDTTVAGTSCISGENTISLTTLTGLGAKDLYIVVKDAAGNVSQPLKITIPAYIAPSYGISASPAALDFGSKTAGYTEAPAAQTVTLTNTGNQNVTVDLPTSTNYIITAGEGFTNDTATLAPNGTAAFTVQPKTGLGAGDYSETLTISGSDGTSASVKLSFTVAFATGSDKAIMLGASNISGYDSTNGYDYIYYGEWDNSPIKWRVLDEQTNTQNEGLFLLSDVLLGTGTWGGVYFDSTSPYGNAWQGSDAQDWCKTFYSDSLTTQEQSAVLETTKSDTAFTSSTYSVPFAASENILNGDKVFFLSAEEAENSAYGFTDDNARSANYGNSAGLWWLRSPIADYTNLAGLVDNYGYVFDYYVYTVWAARPAFNLDLNSVLFISAAEGGKSASGMDSGLTAVGDYDGNEWKLTLLDNSRNFVVTEEAASGKPGDTITLNYTGATTGTNEYISVIIADSSGAQYYGRVAQPADTDGKVEITIPSGLADGTYTLYVFSEQYNGGASDDTKLTDYASAFEAVTLTVSSDTTAPTLSGGSATRDSETAATVKFTSDEAGEYYYAVVESGEAAPTIDTTVAGTSCDTTEQTISPTNLSGAGAKDIYIVVKDAAGNVSQPLTIQIPAYTSTTFTVTVNVDPSDGGTASANYTTAAPNTEITLTATPSTGYHFKEWQVTEGTASIGDDNKFTMPAENVTVKAVFEAHSFTQENTDSEYLASSATCTQAATYYYSCSCGAKDTNNTFTSGEALGHTLGADWKYNDSNHWKECEDCGAKVDEAAHTFAWVTDKPATAAEAGSRHEQCTVCGYRKAAESIPPLAPEPDRGTDEHPEIGDAIADGTWGKTESAPADGETNTEKTVPATGDSSQPVLWIGLLAASGLGIAALLVLRRRKRQ